MPVTLGLPREVGGNPLVILLLGGLVRERNSPLETCPYKGINTLYKERPLETCPYKGINTTI